MTEDSERVTLNLAGEMTIRGLTDAVHHMTGKFGTMCQGIEVGIEDWNNMARMPYSPHMRLTMTGLEIFGIPVKRDCDMPPGEMALVFTDGVVRVRQVIADMRARQVARKEKEA